MDYTVKTGNLQDKLMDKVGEVGGRYDLYLMGEDLVLELDDLLPVVETAELLGFAQVSQGDIVLTPLGQAFAEGSILTRKELVAGRILRQPTLRWIYETLQADPERRVAWEHFLEHLSEDFGDLAEQQLDTAINWGRYAELFTYDDDSGELYIETAGS